MTRATYRCTSGHSTRRRAIYKGIRCPKCGLLASMVDPTPGRPPEGRMLLRCRPLVSSVAELGAEEARRVAATAVDEAAKRRRETVLAAETTHFRVIRPKPLPGDPPHDPDKIHSYTTTWPDLVTSGRPRRKRRE